MPITYLVGDATAPQVPGPKYIVHIVNNVGAWGAGFVRALSNRWDRPEKEYKKWTGLSWFTLGRAQQVWVDKDLWVYNLLAQDGLPSQSKRVVIDYPALNSALEFVANAANNKNASIHMPRIGCGIAGGDWEIVESIIESTCKDLDVYVYDLPPRA